MIVDILAELTKCTRPLLRACVVSLLVLSGKSIAAQTHYSSNVAIGVRGGVEMSHVFFNPSVKQKWPVGVTTGIAFRYIEENHFGLIAELDFAQRGWKEDFEDAPYKYKRTLNYLEIPVMAHIYFGRRGRFFINAGPQISFFMGESTNANFDPSEIDNLPDFPVKNRTNTQLTLKANQKIDYGITAGLGGEFNIDRNNSICIEGRCYYGLGNILKSGRQEAFRASNTLSISATVGYWFRIK